MAKITNNKVTTSTITTSTNKVKVTTLEVNGQDVESYLNRLNESINDINERVLEIKKDNANILKMINELYYRRGVSY